MLLPWALLILLSLAQAEHPQVTEAKKVMKGLEKLAAKKNECNFTQAHYKLWQKTFSEWKDCMKHVKGPYHYCSQLWEKAAVLGFTKGGMKGSEVITVMECADKKVRENLE